MTFARRRNGLTTHFLERIPVVKRRISVISSQINTHCNQVEQKRQVIIRTHKRRPTSAQCVFDSNVSVTCHKHRTAWFPTAKPMPRSQVVLPSHQQYVVERGWTLRVSGLYFRGFAYWAALAIAHTTGCTLEAVWNIVSVREREREREREFRSASLIL